MRWRSPRRLPVTSDRATIVLDGAPIGVPLAGRRRPHGRDDGPRDRATRPGRPRRGALRRPARPRRPRPDRRHRSPDHARRRSRAAGRRPGRARGVRRREQRLRARPASSCPGCAQPIEMVGHVVEPAPTRRHRTAAAGAVPPRPALLLLRPDRLRRRRLGLAVRAAAGRRSPATSATTTSSRCSPRRASRPSRCGSTASTPRTSGSPTAAPTRAPRSCSATSTTGPRSPADHQVDLSRVVLVGHSRGGEGVNRASIQIPLDAPYRIVGQVLLAPDRLRHPDRAVRPDRDGAALLRRRRVRPPGPAVHRQRPRPRRRRHLAEELGDGPGRQPQLLQHRVDARASRRRRPDDDWFGRQRDLRRGPRRPG